MANHLRRAGRAHGVTVNVKEVDILQNKRKHDLTYRARRLYYLELVRSGGFDLVAASPPYGTFSRARGANAQGPRPVRSRAHQRGLPHLTFKEDMQVGTANVLVDFTAEILAAQLEIADSMALLEHPEDLGPGGRDEAPATIWEWSSIRGLVSLEGVVTGALRQSEWGTDYHKPTRLLGRLPVLTSIVHEGWPIFDNQGVYAGPLPKTNDHKTTLIGKTGGNFLTSGSAAWPDALCKCFAESSVLKIATMVPQAGGLVMDIESGKELVKGIEPVGGIEQEKAMDIELQKEMDMELQKAMDIEMKKVMMKKVMDIEPEKVEKVMDIEPGKMMKKVMDIEPEKGEKVMDIEPEKVEKGSAADGLPNTVASLSTTWFVSTLMADNGDGASSLRTSHSRCKGLLESTARSITIRRFSR